MKQNKHQLEHLPILLVQQLRLQWYKDCRGGNAAAQRNQYPRAMRLPKDFFSYYSFGLPTHFVSILQRPNGFQIDKDCRRLIEWKPNGSMRIHPFELIQKESEYGDVDLSGLQKQHYRHYLDAIQDILLEQFGEVGIYTGPWTSGKITKGESNGSQCGTKGAA